MHTSLQFAALPLFLLSIIPAHGQTADPTVVRVTTRLVQVNVLVHGKKGEPIVDLTAEDFKIYDQGRQQKLASFSIESGLPSGRESKPAAPLPPNAFTNLVELRPSPPKAATIILLDGVNTSVQDYNYAKRQLISFLQDLHADDRVAVYTLGKDLRVLHDFTNDARLLLGALARHRTRGSANPAGPETAQDTGDAELAQWANAMDQAFAGVKRADRVLTTLAAIEAIANHAARLPGRKNLVWISGGIPFAISTEMFRGGVLRQMQSFGAELDRAARAVNAADLAIYPVDARGLTNDQDLTSATASPISPIPQPPQAARDAEDARAVMRHLAERTGGKAHYLANGFGTAIRQAIDDSAVSYALSYYPNHDSWDGRFRELKVVVNRKGADVRHRAGYVAFPHLPEVEQDRRAALQEAAAGALEATGIGMFVHLVPGLPAPDRMRLRVRVDARDISFEQQGDRYVGAIDLLWAQQAGPDKPRTIVTETLNLRFPRDTYLEKLKTGLVLTRDIDLAGAANVRRIAVRDAASGRVGSVNIRIDAPGQP